MKRAARFLVPVLLAFVLSCSLDGWGWLVSSDVDDRYADNLGLTVPAAPPAPVEPFSFVVISDTHVFPDNDTAGRFTILQADIAAHGDSFVIACGDLAQNGAYADFLEFQSRTAALGVSVYCVPGNHDLYCGGWPNYRSVLGASMYTVAAGSVRLIAIDSANGTLGGPQRARLESALASAAEPYRFTFTHMEFFLDNLNETQQWTDINEAYSLMHLFETSGVAVHFAGHTHRYLARTINGTELRDRAGLLVRLPAGDGERGSELAGNQLLADSINRGGTRRNTDEYVMGKNAKKERFSVLMCVHPWLIGFRQSPIGC